MLKVWKDNGLYPSLLDKHTTIPANTVLLQVDTDPENNIFPHFAYAVLGF